MIGTITLNTEKTAEEIACSWLLNQKGRKLSNTNVECFAQGFRMARELTASFSESVPDIIRLLRNIPLHRENDAGYSGRCLNDNDIQVMRQAEKIADLLEALNAEVTQYNKICHEDEKL